MPRDPETDSTSACWNLTVTATEFVILPPSSHPAYLTPVLFRYIIQHLHDLGELGPDHEMWEEALHVYTGPLWTAKGRAVVTQQLLDDLRGICLVSSVLCCAVLCCAVLCCAVLCCESGSHTCPNANELKPLLSEDKRW